MAITPDELKDCLVQVGAISETSFLQLREEVLASGATADSGRMLKELQARGILTPFQAKEADAGRGRDLRIGNYLLLNRLGEGGMGTVYKAWHLRMSRVVALKVMRADRMQSDQFTARFHREVQAVARLNHPNIIAAYDADESHLGLFLAMEYVNGADFDKIVEKSGPLSVDEAVEAMRQVAEALGFAHAHEIVHRDIKPANLLRDANGVVKVADLGLAQFEPSELGAARGGQFTESGVIAGTVDFMAPEQATNTRAVDQRADIYSLGCTLFFLLTGRAMYIQPSLAARIVAHRDMPIPSLRDFLPDAPELLDAIYQRMVAKDPRQRFASMQEVVDNLKLLSQPDNSAKRAWTPESCTVILAEPSRFQASVIQSQLRQMGINEVYVFRSGQEVIDALRELPANLILATMQLSDMTGVEMAQHIRDDLSWLRVAIVLTTSSQVAPETQSAVDRLVVSQVLAKPFDQSQLASAVEKALTAQGGSLQIAGLENKWVLLVDDSAMWRLRLQRLLESLGFAHIVTANDGLGAIDCLKSQAFDLVVTDYHMPNMGGKELVGHIRKESRQPDVPILLATTEYDPLKLGEVHQLGASAICHKSSDTQLLRNIVMRLLLQKER